MTDKFYRPKSHILIVTPEDRSDTRRRIFGRIMLAVIILLILAGSGVAETQRIKVMEETSSIATMHQIGITQ